MPAKKHTIGTEIEAYCTKCKMDRLHVIETLKSDGNINRVICRTCEGSHLFRRPKAEGSKPKTASKRRKKGAVTLTSEELRKAKPYSMTGVFAAGDFIQHAKFGAGKVLEVKSPGKMEVGFESGRILLVCGTK